MAPAKVIRLGKSQIDLHLLRHAFPGRGHVCAHNNANGHIVKYDHPLLFAIPDVVYVNPDSCKFCVMVADFIGRARCGQFEYSAVAFDGLPTTSEGQYSDSKRVFRIRHPRGFNRGSPGFASASRLFLFTADAWFLEVFALDGTRSKSRVVEQRLLKRRKPASNDSLLSRVTWDIRILVFGDWQFWSRPGIAFPDWIARTLNPGSGRHSGPFGRF